MFAIVEPTLLLVVTISTIQKSYLFKDEETQRFSFAPNKYGKAESTLQLEAIVLSLLLLSSLLPLLSTVVLRYSPRRDNHGSTDDKRIRGIYDINNMKRDEIGISMGSLLPSLTLLSLTVQNVGQDEEYSMSKTSQHCFSSLVYLTLFSCVGMSFAVVSFGSILHSRLSWRKEINTQEMLPIMHMLFLYVVGVSIYINNFISDNTLQMVQTVVFSILFIAMIYSYEGHSYHGINDQRQIITAMQRVFTIGEWVTLSCFVSMIITDYILKYIMPIIPNPQQSHAGRTLQSAFLPTYMIVSHAGIVGCFIGCIIPISFISLKIQQMIVIQLRRMRLGRQYRLDTCTGQGEKAPNDETIKMSIILCSLRILIVVGCVLSLIDFALYHECLHNDDLRYETIDWCGPIRKTNDGHNNYDYNPMRWVRHFTSDIPTAILWLVDFLISSEIAKESKDRHSFSIVVSRFPRYIWLTFWIAVLFTTTPIAIIIAKSLSQFEDSTKKKKMIVVARKYFHFVAVMLFTPATFYAPSMMFLSYSIASALLIFIESLRLIYFYDSGLQCDKVANPPQSKSDTLETESFTVNEFYQTFFDEKDLGAAAGGFVVTHVALVAGCAIPLWFQHIYGIMYPTYDGRQISNIMPYMGILSLGIGDAAGAIYGSFKGNTRWPESRRTVEGSIAMLVSMEMFVILSHNLTHDGLWAVPSFFSIIWDFSLLCPIVLLEAATSQIDNIYLPLLAIILCVNRQHS